MAATTEIQQATTACQRLNTQTKLYVDYYHGKHRTFPTADTDRDNWAAMIENANYNLCARVVDTTVDRLRITGITSTEQKYQPFAELGWNMWQDQRLELTLQKAATDAGLRGKTAWIVWADENRVIRTYNHPSTTVYTRKSSETGKTMYAAHFWTDDDNNHRVTIYRPEIKEEYQKTKDSAEWKPAGEAEPNPFGFVPVWEMEGIQELPNCVPLQDKMNLSVQNNLMSNDMYSRPWRALVGMEPQRETWIDDDGVERSEELDFDPHSKRFITFIGSPEVKALEFKSNDPSPFLAEQDACAEAIARVSATPMHMLSTGGQPPSGEALKVAEAAFVNKVRRLALSFGGTLSDMLTAMVRMQLLLRGVVVPDDVVLNVVWAPFETVSRKEQLEAAVLMVSMGVPLQVVLTDQLGYSAEAAADIVAQIPAAASPADLFNAGFNPAG